MGTPILEAMSARDLSKLRGLLRARTVQDSAEAQSGFERALCDNLADVVEVFLEEGIDLNSREASGLTPLIWAIHGRRVAMVKRLLAAGAAVNAPDSQGATPLHHAALRQALDLVQLLIQAGADPNCRDDQGKTPLDFARQRQLYIPEWVPLIGDTTTFYSLRRDTPVAKYLRRLSNTT